MNNRTKTMTAVVAASLALAVAAGTPASAAPGRYKVELFNYNNSYLTLTFNCPPTGGARIVGDIGSSAANAATHYKVHYSPCKLTIFEFNNGQGRGVGLQRDGRKYGLGIVTGNAESIASYGS
jgi:hypothetical protein